MKGWWHSVFVLSAVACAAGCHAHIKPRPETPSHSTLNSYDPSIDLGPLYGAAQNAHIFADSKTFADAQYKGEAGRIGSAYSHIDTAPSFDLRRFVEANFIAPMPPAGMASARSSASMEEHIKQLWPALTHAPDTAEPSSLIPLPYRYVVPGGRFREVYYWDSYFTMLGLIQSKRIDLVKDMLDNFAYLLRNVGHIPNGNRTYYLSRSQPPYFAAMVGLYAAATDTANALQYLPELEREHAFWMDGADSLAPGTAWRRAVRLPNGAILNRYWDDRFDPRPESYREDFALAQTLSASERDPLYRNIRAAAESGWDFSSRWMRDPKDLRTLDVIELAPVDLNSLMYDAERTIAAMRRHRHRAGDSEVAAHYDSLAFARRDALLAASYDSVTEWFYDVRWRTGERVTGRPTLAAVAPLYFGLASAEQGAAVSARLGRDFLAPGGFVTSLVASGQQWDAPNGWPPLQWLAIEALRCYGRNDIADLARARWLALDRRVYASTGKMTEKYDVLDSTRTAGGGEYPTQDGFGWTNGVALALSAERLEHTPTASRDHDRHAGTVACSR